MMPPYCWVVVGPSTSLKWMRPFFVWVVASVVPSAEEQTIPFVQKLVPDEVEKFRKLLAK